jgi:hypothetical protein
MAYCQYEFFGETFTTETVEQNTHNPRWDYSFIHHVDRCAEWPSDSPLDSQPRLGRRLTQLVPELLVVIEH